MNSDFSDLFKILNAEKVRYLVVGAYAVTFHAEPRYTKDLDIWIEPELENAKKIWNALAKFGAPLHDLTLDDLTNQDLVYQVGIEPNRIDVLMGLTGVEFSKAWENRIESKYEEIPISILGLKDLIKTKKAVGRPQDLIDAEVLKKRLESS